MSNAKKKRKQAAAGYIQRRRLNKAAYDASLINYTLRAAVIAVGSELRKDHDFTEAQAADFAGRVITNVREILIPNGHETDS